MVDMEGLRHKFDALRAEIKGDMDDMMEEKGDGELEYHTNNMLEVI